MATVTATRRDQPRRPEPAGVEWGRPPAPPGPSGAARGNSLSQVERSGFRARLGKQAGSKANLPAAHPRFFAAIRVELATPGRVGAVHPAFPRTWCLEDLDFSVLTQEIEDAFLHCCYFSV